MQGTTIQNLFTLFYYVTINFIVFLESNTDIFTSIEITWSWHFLPSYETEGSTGHLEKCKRPQDVQH